MYNNLHIAGERIVSIVLFPRELYEMLRALFMIWTPVAKFIAHDNDHNAISSCKKSKESPKMQIILPYYQKSFNQFVSIEIVFLSVGC